MHRLLTGAVPGRNRVRRGIVTGAPGGELHQVADAGAGRGGGDIAVVHRDFGAQQRKLRPHEESTTRRAESATDDLLFAALRTDGRAGPAQPAEATGLSQSTVARHISGLRSEGALYFDVDVDDRFFGVTTRAMLWASVAPGKLDGVAEALARHEELAFLAATTGSTNLIAETLCPDPASLHTYLTKKLGAFDAIRTLETTPVLATVKSTSQPPLLRSRPAR